MRLWQGIKNHFVPSSDNAYRPRLLHRPWLLFFLALTLATEGFLVANLVARQADQNFLAAVVPAEVVALTNAQREQSNSNYVTPSALLAKAAQAKAEDMAARSYFSHNGPDGKTPWQWISQAGYRYQYAGENLAVRFIDSKDVVNAWMQSPTHRENIVKPVYTEIGVGVAQGLFDGEPATYVVQYFASPAVALREGGASPTAVSAPTIASPERSAQSQAAQAPTPGSEQVAGAAVSPPPVVQNNSFTQTLARQLTRLFANPQESAAWVLGTVATLLVLVLGLTVSMHLQVQPTNMLMSGAMVALLALSFLALNSRLTEGSITADSQAASVGYAIFP